MEKKTIVKLCVAGVIALLVIAFACGIGRGGKVDYQIPGPYTAESTNNFSTVQVAMTIQGDQITDAVITSSGDSDLLNDETRAEWAESIVANQSYENDVISSATLTYSAASVKEAAADIFAQAGLPTPEPAATPEPEPETEPEAEGEAEPEGDAAGGLTDGEYAVQKTTDFSTIDVGITVENGAIAAATVASEGANDLLTDDNRNGWAAQIVEKQAVDAVSGVTISSNAVSEAVDELLAQASAGDAAPAADDGRIAELEAAVQEAEAKIAELESAASEAEARADAAESRADEAEAKVAELEAAAAAAVAEAATEADPSRFMRAKPVIETVAPAEDAPAEEAPAEEAAGLADGTYATRKTTDFSTIDVAITVLGGKVTQAVVSSEGANDLLTDDNRSAWAAQIVENQAVDAVSGVTVSSNAVSEAVDELLAEAAGSVEEAAEAEEAPAQAATEAADVDASRFMRTRPVIEAIAPAEEATEEPAEEAAEAESSDADASRFMRARPATEAPTEEAAEEPVEEAAEAESSDADASRFMRARPAAEAPAQEPAGVEAAALTEDERLAAILPAVVVSMGDNRENSYVTDYLEQDPYLVNIYEGYGFAKDYGSARGHEYTLEDVAKTQRPHPKANCLTCKTPDLHKMIEEQGVAVYSMPFDEVMAQMTTNISCYTCHGDDMGAGGALAVTHQYVNEALGENVSTINPATLSCGQCHIEYYFTPSDSETMMPYHSVQEMTPEAILAYYDELGFADWTQESTGTPMLKAQHPEMETYLAGKHAAFLSCADCHMPTEATADGVEYRSHLLVSPLESESLLNTCAQCHGDTDMVAFVHDIQAGVTARETEVGNKLSGMKDALAAAVASGAWSEADLDAVRKLHREAQWFFDFCYVENAEGAHNSELAYHCLDTAEAKIDEALALLAKDAATT